MVGAAIGRPFFVPRRRNVPCTTVGARAPRPGVAHYTRVKKEGGVPPCRRNLNGGFAPKPLLGRGARVPYVVIFRFVGQGNNDAAAGRAYVVRLLTPFPLITHSVLL